MQPTSVTFNVSMSDNAAPLALYYHSRPSAWIQGGLGALFVLLGLAEAVIFMLPRDVFDTMFPNAPPNTNRPFVLFGCLFFVVLGSYFVRLSWRTLSDRSVQLELSTYGIIDHRWQNSVAWSEIQSGALIIPICGPNQAPSPCVIRLKLVRDSLPQTIDINVDRLSKSPWAIHARMKEIAGWA